MPRTTSISFHLSAAFSSFSISSPPSFFFQLSKCRLPLAGMSRTITTADRLLHRLGSSNGTTTAFWKPRKRSAFFIFFLLSRLSDCPLIREGAAALCPEQSQRTPASLKIPHAAIASHRARSTKDSRPEPSLARGGSRQLTRSRSITGFGAPGLG